MFLTRIAYLGKRPRFESRGGKTAPGMLPYDSFLRLQFAAGGINPWAQSQNAALDSGLIRSAPLARERGLTQSDLAFLAYERLSPVSPPDRIITVHHFNDENWFDFTNTRLLQLAHRTTLSYSVIGMGSLGLPLAIHGARRHFESDSDVRSVIVIASDRVLPPMPRSLAARGIFVDGAIAIQLEREPAGEHFWSCTSEHFDFLASPGSWYEPCRYAARQALMRCNTRAEVPATASETSMVFSEAVNASSSDPAKVDFGKTLFDRFWKTRRDQNQTARLIFQEPALGWAELTFARSI